MICVFNLEDTSFLVQYIWVVRIVSRHVRLSLPIPFPVIDKRVSPSMNQYDRPVRVRGHNHKAVRSTFESHVALQTRIKQRDISQVAIEVVS